MPFYLERASSKSLRAVNLPKQPVLPERSLLWHNGHVASAGHLQSQGFQVWGEVGTARSLLSATVRHSGL